MYTFYNLSKSVGPFTFDNLSKSNDTFSSFDRDTAEAPGHAFIVDAIFLSLCYLCTWINTLHNFYIFVSNYRVSRASETIIVVEVAQLSCHV